MKESDTYYVLALEQAKKDLRQRLRERESLGDEINRLKQSIRLLGELAHMDPAEIDKWLTVNFAPVTQLGLTDAVRRAFDTGAILTPVQVRDFVLNLGVGAEQVNLLASIHTTLKRLVEADEIEKFGEADFSNTYRKKTKPPVTANTDGFGGPPVKQAGPGNIAGGTNPDEEKDAFNPAKRK